MIKEQITEFFKGEISDDTQTLDKYSRDASLLKVTPKIVLFPKDVADLKNLVNYVRDNKKNIPGLSITGRSAGTDMGGGPLNESIILDFTSHFKYEKVDVENLLAEVEPGLLLFQADRQPHQPYQLRHRPAMGVPGLGQRAAPRP